MITLAFLFLFCICILCCFLTQKSTLSDAFLVSFGFGTVLFLVLRRFPVLLDGGHHREVVRFVKMLRYPLVSCRYPVFSVNACRGRFRKRNLKHAKECSIQQRRGFACGVCRWKRRFGCSRNSAVSAARFESGFRERDGQGQHWRGPHSHGGFLKMIVCESGGHANGLTYFIFRFLRRPHLQYIEAFLVSTPWGFAPNPSLTCGAAGAGG